MNKNLFEEKKVKLLWTGGWDSTFQLLRLLIIDRCIVTPYYLIHTERKSFGIEIQTMRQIKDRIIKEYPYTKDLLQPTKFYLVSDIASDSEITAVYQSILKKRHIGNQDDWLARFCKENKLTDIQICSQRPHNLKPSHIQFRQLLLETSHNRQTEFRIDPKFKELDEYILYNYYSYPVINITRTQMLTTAKELGWEDVLKMTWFCHNPTRSMKPCGRCNPCLYLIEDGIGWRIPPISRVYSFIHKTLLVHLKSVSKKILKIFGLLKHF